VSAPDDDGLFRTVWRGQRFPNAPVAPVVTSRSITTPAPPSPGDRDGEALVSAPLDQMTASERATFEAYVAERWLAYLRGDDDDDAEEGGECGAEVFACALAALDIGLGARLDAVADAARERVSVLTRSLARLRAKSREECETNRDALAAAQARIKALEAKAAEDRAALAEVRKALASVELGAARDRAHRRMTEARRSYPLADRAALEKARRATDRAVGVEQ
jgi:hypothetical protein